MQDVRTRLAVARDSAPLFDSRQFARDLENLYLQIAS
jgi:predicted O-linked N-acetylglucosamine transferase (SPINDLY family)